uniref:Uncharacterized protein n=2 Tax=Alexandrium monilatum TaxID=311494 RepID=A0A7S4SBU6_9DINO
MQPCPTEQAWPLCRGAGDNGYCCNACGCYANGCNAGFFNPCGCGACPPPAGCGQALRRSYTADEWANWNSTPEGQNLYRWWADWIPTPEGQTWCANKRREARCVVNGMIQTWGLQALCEGEGVIDIGGDPGFVAAELLHSGIHVTVIDPAFGFAGKSDAWTTGYLQDPGHSQRVRSGAMPLRIVRAPFDQTFVSDPANQRLLEGASALVSLYPDEGTGFILEYSAARAMRTALIPCNECLQYFPPHEPTYEGFVKQLLLNDHHYLQQYGQNSPLRREQIWGTPYCQVLLSRTPALLQHSLLRSPCSALTDAEALELQRKRQQESQEVQQQQQQQQQQPSLSREPQLERPHQPQWMQPWPMPPT